MGGHGEKKGSRLVDGAAVGQQGVGSDDGHGGAAREQTDLGVGDIGGGDIPLAQAFGQLAAFTQGPGFGNDGLYAAVFQKMKDLENGGTEAVGDDGLVVAHQCAGERSGLETCLG